MPAHNHHRCTSENWILDWGNERWVYSGQNGSHFSAVEMKGTEWKLIMRMIILYGNDSQEDDFLN